MNNFSAHPSEPDIQTILGKFPGMVISHPGSMFSLRDRSQHADVVSAIPLLRTEWGLRLVLVTARSRRERWIFPKGKTEPELSGATVASKEAFEEGGLLGRIFPQVVATDHRVSGGRVVITHFYLMEVMELAKRWPEMTERRRRLVDAPKAMQLLDEPTPKKIVGFLR